MTMDSNDKLRVGGSLGTLKTNMAWMKVLSTKKKSQLNKTQNQRHTLDWPMATISFGFPSSEPS